MSDARVLYRLHRDVAETESLTLFAVYKFVLDCHAKKRGRASDKSGPDSAKGGSSESSAKARIP